MTNETTDRASVLDRAPWKATNRPAPHEYVVETWSLEMENLARATAELIREEGYWGMFGRRRWRYLRVGAHVYWTARDPGGPLVLNRCRAELAPEPIQ